VTGALGCIGAWTVHQLRERGFRVVAFDRATDKRRLLLLAGEGGLEGVTFVEGDITDIGALESAMRANDVGHVIHLGALQVPACRVDPPLGALVNVVGTTNVFQVARRLSIPHVVYTSSVAVFDRTDDTTGATTPRPGTQYGVFKLANEGTARVYWKDFGLGSIGLRPLTVYGPGRDQGMTSSATKAIVAALLGLRYEVSFGGSTLFNYAGDLARALVKAVLTDPGGAEVFNLNGIRTSIPEFIDGIEMVVEGATGLLTFRPEPLQFPDDVDTSGLELLGPPPVIPLLEGIRQSVDVYRAAQRGRRLRPIDHGLEVIGDEAVDALPTPSAG